MRNFFIALLCSFSTLLAQSAPEASSELPRLTSDQTASILKQLDQIESQITKNRGESLGTALSRFRIGMNSDKDALDLYLNSYKLENFDKKNLKVTDFQEWKDRNTDRHKDPDFLMALRLQLEYLVLSIQAQDTKDINTLVPGLQAYVPKLISAVQSTMKHSASGAIEEKNKAGKGGGGGGGGNRQGGAPPILAMLRQPVKGTVIAQAYRLDEFLTRKEWEYDPTSIAGIYNSVIFPCYLKEKKEELPAQWDARINAELALRKATQSETEFQVYYYENHPQLLWSKSVYLLQRNVNPIGALAEMLKIVRDNPTHPKAADWLQELRKAVDESRPVEPTKIAVEETPAVPTGVAP